MRKGCYFVYLSSSSRFAQFLCSPVSTPFTHLCKELAPNYKRPACSKSSMGASVIQTCHFLRVAAAGVSASPPGSLLTVENRELLKHRTQQPRTFTGQSSSSCHGESAGPGPEGTSRAGPGARTEHASAPFTFFSSYLQCARRSSLQSASKEAHAVLTDSAFCVPQQEHPALRPITNTPQRPYCTAQPAGS